MNVGNTCFLNSAVQCLSHTLPMTEYFLDDGYKADVRKRNPLGSKGGGVASSFAKLTRALWLSRAAVVDPSAFRKKLAKFAPLFAAHEQQDVQEFVATLLDALHEDLNRAWTSRRSAAAAAATAAARSGGAVEDSNPGEREVVDGNPTARVASTAALPVRVAAAIQWQAYLSKNKSVVGV